MKKFLLLLIAPLLFFNSCEEEEEDIENNISNCDVNFTFNGDDQIYNPIAGACAAITLNRLDGNIVTVGMNFSSNCSSTYDYTIDLMSNSLTGSTTYATLLKYDCNIAPLATQFNLGYLDSEINESNNTISGEFYLSSNGMYVNCSFTNLKFNYADLPYSSLKEFIEDENQISKIEVEIVN